MNNNTPPKTAAEWKAYIGSLSPEDVFRKADAANQVSFVETLREEGAPPEAITGIFRLFLRRMEMLGGNLPGKREGSYLDYYALQEQDRALNAVEVD